MITKNERSIFNMDLQDPANTPLLRPPAGVTPDFVNPLIRAPETYAISYVLFALNTVAVVARLYTKGIVMKKIHMDDCMPT